MTAGDIVLLGILAFVLFVSVPCWISVLRQRKHEEADSLRRLTPEQYEDYVGRMAAALIAQGYTSEDLERLVERMDGKALI